MLKTIHYHNEWRFILLYGTRLTRGCFDCNTSVFMNLQNCGTQYFTKDFTKFMIDDSSKKLYVDSGPKFMLSDILNVIESSKT